MLVAQLCPTVCNPTDCSLPGSSVHGILQARILEWVAITVSKLTIVGCLKYPTWWFDKHYEWIPSIKWIQPSPHILCVCMCEREKLTSTLSKFQLHITVWSTLVTILHVKFSTFYSSYYWKFVPFYNSSWLPQPPSLWQPLSLLWVWFTIYLYIFVVVLVQSLSHVRLLSNPMDCSTPDSSVFFCLLEFAQIHASWISGAI